MTPDIKNYGCVMCEESRFTWREDSDIPVWYCKQTGEELERDTDGKLRPVKECEEANIGKEKRTDTSIKSEISIATTMVEES